MDEFHTIPFVILQGENPHENKGKVQKPSPLGVGVGTKVEPKTDNDKHTSNASGGGEDTSASFPSKCDVQDGLDKDADHECNICDQCDGVEDIGEEILAGAEIDLAEELEPELTEGDCIEKYRSKVEKAE